MPRNASDHPCCRRRRGSAAVVAFALVHRPPCCGAGAPRLRWHQALAARIWSPHAATAVIGVTFVVLLLLVGRWAYTDVLAELARGHAAERRRALGLLAVALLVGAVLGGWTGGCSEHPRCRAGPAGFAASSAAC